MSFLKPEHEVYLILTKFLALLYLDLVLKRAFGYFLSFLDNCDNYCDKHFGKDIFITIKVNNI